MSSEKVLQKYSKGLNRKVYLSLSKLKRGARAIRTVNEAIPNSLKKLEKENRALDTKVLSILTKKRFIEAAN